MAGLSMPFNYPLRSHVAVPQPLRQHLTPSSAGAFFVFRSSFFGTRRTNYEERITRQFLTPVRNWRRFRLFRFRSPLLSESRFLSFPGGTKMFQFPPFASVLRRIIRIATDWVYPLGDPRINACLAAPRGLSQLTTSFIAGFRQGIHPMPLVA